MRKLLIAATAACAAMPASAQDVPNKKIDVERPSYDRKLEQAVLRIVAGRIGDLRGPLISDMGPLLVALDAERVRLIGMASQSDARLSLRLFASAY